jgi:hypothetical protein
MASRVDELAARLAQARDAARRSGEAVEAARGQYQAGPSLKLKDRETTAIVAHDVALHTVAALERELAAAEHEAQQSELRVAYDAVAPLVGEAERLHTEYETLARKIAGLVPRIFEIEAALDAANGRLPEGASPFPLPSEMRGIVTRRHRTFRTEGWVDAAGEPIDRDAPAYMRRSKAEGPPVTGAKWGSWEITRQIHYQLGDPLPSEPFTTDLKLPGLRLGAPQIWPVKS